jgi:hypothetical protein
MTMQHVSAASRALMVETFSTSTTLDVVFYHFEASDAGMTLISIPHHPEGPSLNRTGLQL